MHIICNGETVRMSSVFVDVRNSSGVYVQGGGSDPNVQERTSGRQQRGGDWGGQWRYARKELKEHHGKIYKENFVEIYCEC